MKQKVVANVLKQKQAINEFVAKKYDKLKTVEFDMNANTNGYRTLDKKYILQAGISPTAKGIYPVLCMMSDFKKDKKFQISISNIGKYSGNKDWSTISKAIKELSRERWISCEKIENERRYWIYGVDFIRTKDFKETSPRNTILFFDCLIKSGTWASLTPKEQNLYLTLRALAEFEYDSIADG